MTTPDAPQSAHSSHSARAQLLIALGVLGVLVYGALSIPSDAGHGGVDPNFQPWVVVAVLAVCGGWLLWEVATGGFRQLEEPSGASRGDWSAFAWVSAGVLVNAALITSAGIVLSCALCFALAVRGLRLSEGKPVGGVRQTVIDAVTGMLIAAPVYWLFTKLLAINLPGLTGTGWI